MFISEPNKNGMARVRRILYAPPKPNQDGVHLSARDFDLAYVALLRWRPNQPDVQGCHVGLDKHRPVHPTIGIGPGGDVFWPHAPGAVPGSQVANNDVRLPDDVAILVPNDRDETIGV